MVPATLVLITPEVTAADLPGFSKEFAMENAVWAYDPVNAGHISLQNILQSSMFAPGGRETPLGFQGVVAQVTPVISGPNAGSFTYPVAGLTDAKAKELWWMVERNKPGAIKTLAEVVKQKTPLGRQAAKIFAVVNASFRTREAALDQAPVSMETVEAFETMLTEGEGLDLKRPMAHYKLLLKRKQLKDELTARSMYRECQVALNGQTTSQQQEGKDGMAVVASKYPKTVYGQLAAAIK